MPDGDFASYVMPSDPGRFSAVPKCLAMRRVRGLPGLHIPTSTAWLRFLPIGGSKGFSMERPEGGGSFGNSRRAMRESSLEGTMAGQGLSQCAPEGGLTFVSLRRHLIFEVLK